MKHYDPKKFVPEASRDAVTKATDRTFRLWPRVLGGLALVALLVIGCGGWAATWRKRRWTSARRVSRRSGW